MKTTANYIFLICLLACLVVACDSSEAENIQLPQEGVLDLSGHDFSTDVLASMSGEWEFYENELLKPAQIASGAYSPQYVNVPHYWEDTDNKSPHGYATYHVLVKLPKNTPTLALKIPFIPMACNIFINDELIHQNGEVATSEAQMDMNISPIHKEISMTGESFTMSIQLSNYQFNAGGLTHEFFLGTASEVLLERKYETIIGLLLSGGLAFLGVFLILASFIGIIELGLAHLGICFIALGYWNSSAWSKLFNVYLPNYDWGLSIRIEFLAVFVFTYALLSFSKSIYAEESEFWFVRFLQGIEIALGISILLVPLTVCFTIIDSHLIVIAFMFLYFGLVVIRALRNRRRDVLFAAWGLAFGTVHFFLYLALDNNIELVSRSTSFLANVVMFIILLGIVLYRQLNNIQNLSKQAAAGTQAKTQFLSVISHEMRTPMNGILGMTELLHTTPMSSEQKSYVQSIQTSGESLITLIDDILDLTRIREGKLKIEKKHFDVHLLVNETFKLFEQQVKNKGLQLHLNIDPDVPQYLQGSPIRIKQVIDNLVNNALKFTEQGYIKINLNAEEIDEDTLELHCAIEDTGIGISMDKQREIFKRFSQVDSTISRRQNGVGLGLAICQRLVSAMGGDIGVRSTPGKGSTFSFYVRVEEGNPPVEMVTDKIIPTTQAEEYLEILIAEDNVVNMKLMQMGLKKLGYDSDGVVNGQQALQASIKKNYDLILMDIQMPEMDGLEATRLILQEAHTGYTPYIAALTANAFPEDKQHAFEAGVDNYLVKPVQLAKIKALLVTVTERKQKHRLGQGQGEA